MVMMETTPVPICVFVTINGLSNCSNHYGFKASSTVTVKIFDEKSDCIIAEETAFVHLAQKDPSKSFK